LSQALLINVPHADVVPEQKALLFDVVDFGQGFLKQHAEEAPELVLPVRVIVCRRQRCRRRKTAENQRRNAGIENRRQTLQHR